MFDNPWALFATGVDGFFSHSGVRTVLDFVSSILEPAVGPVVDWADANASDLTKGYPLMSNGRDVFAISALYVVSVLLLVGPLNRFIVGCKLTVVSFIHNVILVALSSYMAFGIAIEFYRMATREGKIICLTEGSGDIDRRLANVLYVFYLSKVYEFVDTFIMIAKRKFNQVSFLHVYHHSSIFPYWYLILRTCPGGDAWLTAFLNSGVHVLMYSYYLLAAMKVTVPWKQWVTRSQMIQFCLFLAQSFYVTITDCHVGAIRTIGHGLIAYAFSLLALFAHFYVKTYMAKKGKKKAGKSKKE